MEKEKSDALNKAIKTSFGAKFEIARKNAGFSRAKLGTQIGVSGKTVQSWENGRTWPENMSLIPVIEKILGIFIPKILGETVREEVEKAIPASESKPQKIIRRAAVTDEEENTPEIKTEEIDEV